MGAIGTERRIVEFIPLPLPLPTSQPQPQPLPPVPAAGDPAHELAPPTASALAVGT